MYANGMANKAAHANDIAYTVLTLFENIHPPPCFVCTCVLRARRFPRTRLIFLPVVVAFVLYFSAMADFPSSRREDIIWRRVWFSQHIFAARVLSSRRTAVLRHDRSHFSLCNPEIFPRVDDVLPRIRPPPHKSLGLHYNTLNIHREKKREEREREREKAREDERDEKSDDVFF